MSTGMLIEAPPISRADINDRIAVDRGGVEWVGWVRALNGETGALMQWDNGSQGSMLWSEPWRKLPKEEPAQPKSTPPPLYPTCDNSAAVTIELARIQPFELNPREFKKLPDGTVDPDQHGLRELAASLIAQGQEQPIIVRPLGNGKFGLVDGERRYWAATLAGMTELRVDVRERDDAQALADTIAATCHARPYSLADQARAVEFLLSLPGKRSQEDVATMLGCTQQDVSALSRFRALPAQVQELVKQDRLKLGHVRQLVRDHLRRAPKALIWIAEHAAETRASVRALEAEIPFEDEMPAELRKALRPQPVMELETAPSYGECSGCGQALPGPDGCPDCIRKAAELEQLVDQAETFAKRNGHQLGEWSTDAEGVQRARCQRCTGSAAIFTTSVPPGASYTPKLQALCDGAQATPRPGVEMVPAKPNLAELESYRKGLQNYPPKAVVREYASYRDATDPAAYQWRTDACFAELERRRHARVDAETLLYCEIHSDYQCRTCAAAERVTQMSGVAGLDPAAMLQTNSATATVPPQPNYSGMIAPAVIEEMEAHEAAGVELPADQHNARIDALEEKVLADASPAPDPKKQPIKTAAEIAAERASKPGALKTAEEIVAEKATPAPALGAPTLPTGWEGQPVQTLIPANIKNRLNAAGGAVIPALTTYCDLAEVAKDNGLQAAQLVGYVARFLAYARWRGKPAEELLTRYEAAMQAEEA